MKNIIQLLFLFTFILGTFCLVDNCATYKPGSSDSECIKCNAAFVLEGTGATASCYPEITNCAKHKSPPSTCDTCQVNYNLSPTSKSCVLTIPNCEPLFHSDAKTCLKCLAGFTVSATGLTCVKTIGTCLLYDDLGACYQVDKCSTYANKVGLYKCTACFKSEASNTENTPSASGRFCVKVIPDCTAYEDNGKCTTCSGGKSPTSTGFACQASLHASCSANNDDNICTSCRDSLKVPAALSKLDCETTGACVSNCYDKISDCASYKSDGTCFKCAAGFQVTVDPGAGKCAKIIPNCNKVDAAGKCKECPSGYSVNSLETGCVKTITDCTTHSVTVGKCDVCGNNKILSKSGTACVSPILNCLVHDDVATKCSTCDAATALNSDATVCLLNFVKVTDCLTYDVRGQCEKCIAGKYLNIDKQCLVPQFFNPAQCEKFDPFVNCVKCITGFTMSSTRRACGKNVDGCLDFDDKGICNRCESTKVLFKGFCYTKINECVEYRRDGKCLLCRPEFTLKDPSTADKCVRFVEGCNAYDDNGCTACGDTLILSESPNKKCVKKAPNCATYYDNGRCKTCDSGFELSGSGLSCPKIIADCAKYDDVSFKCIDCGAKIPSLKGDACFTKITDCVVHKEEGKCFICKDGKLPKAADQTTCEDSDPNVLTTVADAKIDLYGAGQIVYNVSNVLYCLAHGLGNNEEIDLASDSAKNLVSLIQCSDVLYSRTLWEISKLPANGAAVPKDSSTTRDELLLDSSLTNYYITAVIPTPAAIKSGVTTYSKARLRLVALANGNLRLRHNLLTSFSFSKVTTTIGQDLFNVGFSIKTIDNYNAPIAGADDDAILSTTSAGTADTKDKFIVVSNPYVLATSIKYETVAPTANFFDFRQVKLDATTAQNKAWGLSAQVTTTVESFDDFINISWKPAGDVTDLSNIFPVLQGRSDPKSTRIGTLCNFRYPDISRIPFTPGFKAKEANEASGAPKDASLIQISVMNLPIYRLVDCGFFPSYDATTTYTVLQGRYGYFTGKTNYGVFKDLDINIGEQRSVRKFTLDNADSFDWFLDGDKLTVNLKLNSQIRFLHPTTFRELLPANELPALSKGLFVNSTSPGILVRIDLVSTVPNLDADPTTLIANSDRNFISFQPLGDSYRFVNVKPQLLRKVGDARYDKVTLAALNLKKDLNNTCTFLIDLRKVITGEYFLVVDYTVTHWKTPKRILATEEISNIVENVEEEISHVGGSSQIKFTYDSNGINNLKINGLFLLLVICFAFFWGN